MSEDMCACALERERPQEVGQANSHQQCMRALAHTVSSGVSSNFLILANLKGDSSNPIEFNFHFCQWAFATDFKDIFLL